MIRPSRETLPRSSAPGAAAKDVSRADLFLGFLKIGLMGFGGVAPSARHIIVDERRWLSERDYAAILGIGQALPGANTVNAAVMIGDRFQGAVGAMLCVAALMTLPLGILIGIATLYAAYIDQPLVEAAITGAAASAAGLIVGTAMKMIQGLGFTPFAFMVCATAFVAVGLLGWPLVPVLAVLVPLSVCIAAIMERRR